MFAHFKKNQLVFFKKKRGCKVVRYELDIDEMGNSTDFKLYFFFNLINRLNYGIQIIYLYG